MNDRHIECVECGRTFVWTYSEQRFYRQRGLQAPRRCKACRARYRERASNGLRGAPAARRSPSPPTHPAGPSAGDVARGRTLPWRAGAALRFGVLGVGGAVALMLLLSLGLSLGWGISWPLSFGLVTFVLWKYDKDVAGSDHTRVPELVLLLMAALGGTVGALLGMWVWRHKSAKGSFQLGLWLIVVLQILGVVVWYGFIGPGVGGG